MFKTVIIWQIILKISRVNADSLPHSVKTCVKQFVPKNVSEIR